MRILCATKSTEEESSICPQDILDSHGATTNHQVSPSPQVKLELRNEIAGINLRHLLLKRSGEKLILWLIIAAKNILPLPF